MNGETYYYMIGGCGNPQNNSWGYEDCHTQYQVIEGTSIQAVLECDTGLYECYYTETGDDGGGPDNNGDGDGGGTCSRGANGGACPAYCASCSP